MQEEINKEVINILKKSLLEKVENDFKNGKKVMIQESWFNQGPVIKYNKDYTSPSDTVKEKIKVVEKINNLSESKLFDLMNNDIIGEQTFIKRAFSLFDKEQTKSILLMMLKNKSKIVTLKDLLIRDGLINYNHVINSIWENKTLLNNVINKKTFETKISDLDILISRTSTTERVEAFKKIYSLIKISITEQTMNTLSELENKYLSNIQRILLNKSRPAISVQKQKIDIMDDFINKNEIRMVSTEINLYNKDIVEMGFYSLDKYILGKGDIETQTNNEYAKFRFTLNSRAFVAHIEYNLEKDKNNYSKTLEQIVKKTMVLFLKNIEKEKKLLDEKFGDFFVENLASEKILQEFNNNRQEKLIEKMDVINKDSSEIVVSRKKL